VLAVLNGSIDPRPLALCRILVGLAGAGFAFEWIGVLARAASGQYMAVPVVSGMPTPTPAFVVSLFAVSLVGALAMVLGVAGRVPALLVAVTTVTVLLVEQQAYSNHLVLLSSLSLLLGMSGAAQAWTLSRSTRAAEVPYWPAFLIKAQITSVYAWTAISKLNPDYLDGRVLSTFLQPWVPVPHHLLPAFAALSVLAEATLAIFLWVPKLRKPAFAMGAALHLGILVLLQDPAPLIGFAMLMAAGYVLFAWAQEPLSSNKRAAARSVEASGLDSAGNPGSR
jgi:hypothetical protein